ncbi:MAG: hypothetical protein WBP59_01485 [Ilumatobacteraceae bacterium]
MNTTAVTTPTEIHDSRSAAGRAHRRKVVAAAVLLATVAVSACSSNTDGPTTAEPDLDVAVSAADVGFGDQSEVADDDPATTEVGDDAEDANDLLDDSDDLPDPEPPAPVAPGPAADDDADAPVELDPVTPAAPETGPCDDLPADGSSLVVGPDPLVLDKGDLSGSLFIVNCGDEDIDWTASTKPTVALDDDGANLLPGAFAELDFVIDHDAWAPGAVDFKIKVSEPGHNSYIDIHAFRQLVGTDVVAGGGNLSAGVDAGGCANQCITSALLKPNFTSPDLGLDIATNTPAKIRTWLSKNAPVDVDGVPSFPGVTPRDVSPSGVSSHYASLSNLLAGTKYHIIVSATDDNDNTSYRVGEFTTITPVQNPGDFALPGQVPGCAAGCITKAQLTAGDDHTSKNISIASHTAAQFQVFVSTDEPVWANGVPSFADNTLWIPSGLEYVTEWNTTLTDLDASTGYHIIVRATDGNDNVDHRTGQFHTPAAPAFSVRFTNIGIDVTYDGDKNANRGELRFGWRVGDSHAGSRGEAKISSGDWVEFGSNDSTFVAHGITEILPPIAVAGFERDPDGRIEFCSMGWGVPIDNGSNSECDVVWSVAGGGIHTLDGVAALPTCASVGFAAFGDQRCIFAPTGDTNGGRPEFTSVIAIDVLD